MIPEEVSVRNLPNSSYGKVYIVTLTIICTYNLEKHSSLKAARPEKGHKNDDGTGVSILGDTKNPDTDMNNLL